MSKYYLFFVFGYCEKTSNKRQARSVRVGKMCNLKSIIDSFSTIKNSCGQIAHLETVTYMETEQKANETAAAWNGTYKAEKRLFE